MSIIRKHINLDTLDNVISAIPSNIFFKDTELNYVFSSHIWEQVDSGDDEEFDIYGKSDRDIRKDTANLDNVEKSDQNILKTGIGTRYTIKSEVDGHLQFLELVKEPVRDDNGNIVGIVGLINDVTAVTKEMSDMLENEKAYREAMKTGARLAYNVNLTRDILEDDLIEEVDGRIINLLDILGLSAPCSYDEMVNKYCETILNGDCAGEYKEIHNTQKLIELYESGQRAVSRENRLMVNGLRGNTMEIWSYETILLMRNTKDEIVAFITVNDTTEQRKKEEKIRRQLEENVVEANRIANMKSDFLANMSHEIRTPMNAVIGMAEMALRESLPPAAEEYIKQIKSSGNALLNIINDILDFSKIESGKMDIIPDNYNLITTIKDVSDILLNRIGEKNLELVTTVNPLLPKELYGDVMRIRQVLINLANNAVKFTKEGYVHISVDFDTISEEEIMLKVAVEDTGVGIKEEDLDKLFVAFQQVDSKRNRNIEGTGLGLAISTRLVELMGGKINVSSVYGQGSVFSFEIPQKIVDPLPSLEIKEKEQKTIVCLCDNNRVCAPLKQLLDKLQIDNCIVDDDTLLTKKLEESSERTQKFVLTSYRLYKEKLDLYAENHPETEFIVISDLTASAELSKANVHSVKKPLSTIGISMVLNNETIDNSENDAVEFDFVAPDARVLIVDDNEVNLLVAGGLLEPLKMQVTTALSGKKALELVDNEKYDLIFMDHMMPELDGIETTKIIREKHPELSDMPIIALSANAVGNAREMFISEGMNDFVAKPIEIKTITAKLRQWLPNEKLQKMSEEDIKNSKMKAEEEKLVLGDLDTEAAIELLGTKKFYMSVLETYFRTIKTKAEAIKQFEQAEDIKSYTIAVHALKSASKQIGAMELSDMAAKLEACGNAGDSATIHAETNELIDKYLSYYEVLAPVFVKEDDSESKPEITKEELWECFDKMLVATDELDMGAMQEVSETIDGYRHSGEANELNSGLKSAVENIDIDTIEEIIAKWRLL